MKITFFNIGLSLSIICLTIYCRLFRNFYNIPFYSELFAEHLLSFEFLCIINSFLTIISLYTIYKLYFISGESKIFIVFAKPIVYLNHKINDGYTYIYSTIFESYFLNNILLLLKLISWFKEKKYSFFIFFLGQVLPRMIIIIVLIIEIYLEHLRYYYYTLLLLIIPLITQLIVFILKDSGSRLIKFLDNYIIFIPLISKEQSPEILYHFKIIMREEYNKVNVDFFLLTYYLPALEIKNIVKNKFLPQYTKIRLFTLFLYFFVHAVCWGYILIVYF